MTGLTERTWPSILLVPISVSEHVITVSSTFGLKAKMKVILSLPGITEEEFEIKRVYDQTTLMVGPVGKSIKKTSDASKFDGGTLSVPEQSRNVLGDAPIVRAVYEEEPTLAIRTYSVDPWGTPWTAGNPFPVQIPPGSIDLQITHKDDFPDPGDTASSIQIGDGTDILQINPNGSINVVVTASGQVPELFTDSSGAFTDTTETTISTYTTADPDVTIKTFLGEAPTFGIWRLYLNSISPSNLQAAVRTSFSVRTAKLNLDQPISLPTIGDSLIVTFQAERYRANMLGLSASTFVRLEGFK